MAIAKLNIANIYFDRDHYNDVLLKLYNRDDFHPEPASKFTDSVIGLSAYSQENVYEEILNRISEMRKKYGLEVEHTVSDTYDLNVAKTKEYLDDVYLEVDRINAVKLQLEEMIEESKEAIIQLEQIKNFDFNFDDLFSCHFLQVRFGKIPIGNIAKLGFYQALPFVYMEFKKDDQYVWCMYVTGPADAPEIDNIFSSLYFERIRIPNFVHGEPNCAIAEIQEEINVAQKQGEILDQRIKKILQENKDELNRIYSISDDLSALYQMQKYIVMTGENQLVINGFIPARGAKKFKQELEATGSSVSVDLLPANGDVRLKPPTLLRNNWFSRPFRMFVEMYGTPAYDDTDPTMYVALSYTLLFGIMFADLGQGLLLSLVGLIAYKVFNFKLGAVGVRVGLSSALFGFVFGSVFGNEDLITPIFNAMDSANTMNLLMVSVGLGIGLILISMLVNIILNIKKKNYPELLFSQNALPGLIFYVAVLLGVVGNFIGIKVFNPLYILLLIVLPMVVIFFKEPATNRLKGKKMFPEGIGSFLVVGFFELFEVVLTFLANTLSFLRVGGFVLAHAGMMLVVYTIAEMFGPVGYFITLVIGNIFVMCMEGLIVGIQVLRLEFYEMFSRYFEGNGIPFKTIKEETN